MTRERYPVQIKCGECKQEGTLTISENDYPFMRNLDRAVRVKHGEFEAHMINDDDAQVTCLSCGNKFTW
ncbi:hypothetical protein CWC12_10420 [Pseudoalteromonas ruthenica]|nr:hypothetical protein CWC12_10420 [Pseudoalteromonas ruthenica]TMP20855.1 hypothetical protein CWC06_19540 [Pseudoalteromonas ruthenica]